MPGPTMSKKRLRAHGELSLVSKLDVRPRRRAEAVGYARSLRTTTLPDKHLLDLEKFTRSIR